VSLIVGDSSAACRPTGLSLAIAGSASVATAFGMARYGYGLLLPDIKRTLALGETELGAIGTLAYLTYIAAALLVDPAVRHLGARRTVVVGGALGVAGTATIAVSANAVSLAAGVGVAGASAGLVYPPFAEALRGLPEATRSRALAAINCGTGWGVSVAAPIAIVAASSWRLAYLGFAACVLLSTVYAARVLPAATGAHPPPPRRLSVRDLRPGAWRVIAGALLIGLGSGAFWTFAVQDVRAAGLDVTAASALLGLAGIGSVVGIGAADLVDRLGLLRTFVACALLEATSTALLAIFASSLGIVLASAFAFGVSYNIAVAASVLSLTRLHSEHPASAVAVIAGANATGLLFSPVAGAALSTQVGLTTMLVCGAGVLLAAMVGAPTDRGCDEPDRASPAAAPTDGRRAGARQLPPG
jgi:predicted MFS family arabinose efflux permease